MKALSQIVPEQISAGIGNLRVVALSGLNMGQHWVHIEITLGSYGGRFGMDGMDAAVTLYANTRNNPVKDIESHVPLRVTRYELRHDTKPPGRWRGGIGTSRDFTLLSDAGFSIKGGGHAFKPWGLLAGTDGRTASLTLIAQDDTKRDLPSKVPYGCVKAGDRLISIGPCGGGSGQPFQRAPELVLSDVLNGLIPPETAARDYGVVILDGQIDHPATARLRD